MKSQNNRIFGDSGCNQFICNPIFNAIILILAIAGLVCPWYYNIQFFANGSLAEFVAASSGNLANQSISFDLFIATVVGSTWMYFESKRLNMKFGFVYILIGFLIAYSFALPLFLYVREGQLDQASE